MTDKGERVVSRARCEKDAEEDPILAGMIRDGVPLTRNRYLVRAWGEIPRDWNAEHEMEVPECFRDPDAVKHDAGKKRHVHDG